MVRAAYAVHLCCRRADRCALTLAGKCCANIRTDDLDLEHPKELMNLDVGNKRSTGQAIAAIPYGRFSAAPRSELPPQIEPVRALRGRVHAASHSTRARTSN